MKLYQRADFWILLLLVGGLAGYFVWPRPPVVPGGDGLRFSVGEMSLKRDYGNFLAAFEVDYDNREGEAFDPALEAKLLAAGERVIPGYFLATGTREPVPAGEKAKLTLKYWLEAADLLGPLTLAIRGETLEVKSGAPFDGEAALENQATKSFEGAEWK